MDKYEYKYNPETDALEWLLNSMVVSVASSVLISPIGVAFAYGYLLLAVDPAMRWTRLPETFARIKDDLSFDVSIFEKAEIEREADRIRSLMQGAKYGTAKHKVSCIQSLAEMGIEVKSL
jgi:hypothetical protein